MDYVRKIVGGDEKLIGIARLHWIYLLRGAVWFFGYFLFGLFLHEVISHVAATAATIMQNQGLLTPIIILDNYSESATTLIGAVIFACFAMKYATTEIGLTNRRVIRKEGLAFVHVHEVDLEEVHGEKMDLGYFGKLLGYAYIKLNCRFVGNFTTPAIRRPEQFMRALHQARSKVTDSAAMIATKPEAANNAQPATPPASPSTTPAPVPTPAPTAAASPAIDPATLSQIVAEIVPQVVAQVTEKMSPQDDAKPSAIPQNADAVLLDDFGKAVDDQNHAVH